MEKKLWKKRNIEYLCGVIELYVENKKKIPLRHLIYGDKHSDVYEVEIIKAELLARDFCDENIQSMQSQIVAEFMGWT